MFTIHLNNLKFYSFHGLYAEEKIVGGEYEVNATVSVDLEDKVTAIQQTVDYTAIYSLIKKQMSAPAELLETLAQNMVDAIGLLDNRIKNVSINIKKVHPPIEQFTGSIGVTCFKDF
jgi:7,8-dihydroneopterin aldolase/epimerase/oxygenase